MSLPYNPGLTPIPIVFKQPPDKHGVCAHTPDPTKYHQASPSTGQRASSGTVIPRAGNSRFGPSTGFDCQKPGKVFVDPIDDATGAGGMMVDLGRVSMQMAESAVKAAQSQSTDLEQQRLIALEVLSVGTSAPQSPVANGHRENTVFPNSYVVPASLPGGSQVPVFAQPQPQQPQQTQQPQPTPMLNQQQQPEPNPWMLVASLQSQVADLLRTVQGQQQHISSMASRPQQQPADQQLRNPSLDDDTQPPQVMSSQQKPEKPVEDKPGSMIPKERAVQLIRETLESFKIPELGPTPMKPKYEVVFDLGQAGKHSCRFHWIVEHEQGLFLVYDTRFEDGVQYSPPDMGDKPVKVLLPRQNKQYMAYSTDFTLPFGVFKIVNLILVSPDRLQDAASGVMQSFGVPADEADRFLNIDPHD